MNKINRFFSLWLCFLTSTTLIAQQFLNQTVVHDGITRAYTVYIPANYQEATAMPLLFNFHGGSGDIASQIAISDMRPIADTAGFIIVYPQALPDPNAGGSTIWTHKAPTTVDDVFFVAAMIDTLVGEYAIDVNRVYACGYSNGGEFAFELACRLSDRIAAIGVVARSMFIETLENCAPTHPTGIVTIHGTKDDYEGITFAGTTFYPSLAVINNYWANFNNADATPIITELPDINSFDGSTVEHYSWANGNGCVAIEHFKVINGGHDWPGSFGNMDMDASVEIWNYVSKYDLNGLITCSTTSLQNDPVGQSAINIYPNPANNQIILDLGINNNQTYHIYATNGEILLSGVLSSTNKIIDISALPATIYFIKIGNSLQKFIKLD